MMLLLNKEEGATYAFMLSRVYLQLDINHQVKERKKLEFEKVFNFKVLNCYFNYYLLSIKNYYLKDFDENKNIS